MYSVFGWPPSTMIHVQCSMFSTVLLYFHLAIGAEGRDPLLCRAQRYWRNARTTATCSTARADPDAGWIAAASRRGLPLAGAEVPPGIDTGRPAIGVEFEDSTSNSSGGGAPAAAHCAPECADPRPRPGSGKRDPAGIRGSTGLRGDTFVLSTAIDRSRDGLSGGAILFENAV